MLSLTRSCVACKPVASPSNARAFWPLGLSARQRSIASRSSRLQAAADDSSSVEVAAAGGATVEAVVQPQQQETSPFLDPLVRSLFLGVGAGIVCEAMHVFVKVASMIEAGSLLKPFTTDFVQQFSPAFVADHAVAIGAWILLYAVEAAAIASLMARSPANEGTTELSSVLSSLPSRKMFPSTLTPVKDAIANTLAAGATAAATTGSTAAAAVLSAAAVSVAERQARETATPLELVAAPPGLSKELEKALEDIEKAAAGSSSSSGSSAGSSVVAEPPHAAPPKEKTKAQKKLAPTGPIKQGEGLRRQQQEQQQADEARRGLSKRDQELRDRKAYLKNFWYAAALSESVKDKPVGVHILGARVTLFRDESGKVVAVDETCPHRGAPLSEGWTTTEKSTGKKCVVCPYHGWAFDSQGKLRDVPSAEEGSWPRRPLIGAYDVEERGGFVWLFYGNKSMPADERPPIPFTPELEDPQWRAVYGEIEFQCGHWGVFENAIDMAHIHYLHADSFGNSEKPKVMEMQSERDTFATTCTFRIHNKPVNKMWEWTAVPSVPVTAKAMLPSTSAVTIELAHGVKMITFVNTVPINEHQAINRFCLIRNFAINPAFDFMARDNMYKILGEDKVMVDKLAPERLEAEYSLAPDLPQIAFRQLRQEWIDMGYGVPPESELPRRGLMPKGY